MTAIETRTRAQRAQYVVIAKSIMFVGFPVDTKIQNETIDYLFSGHSRRNNVCRR